MNTRIFHFPCKVLVILGEDFAHVPAARNPGADGGTSRFARDFSRQGASKKIFYLTY